MNEPFLDAYLARLAELTTRAADTSRALRGIAATASSRDGAATVTVDAAGALQNVILGAKAESLPKSRLADAVLEAAQRAQAQAGRDTVEAMAALLGPRSAAMGMLREQLRDRPGERAASSRVSGR